MCAPRAPYRHYRSRNGFVLSKLYYARLSLCSPDCCVKCKASSASRTRAWNSWDRVRLWDERSIARRRQSRGVAAVFCMETVSHGERLCPRNEGCAQVIRRNCEDQPVVSLKSARPSLERDCGAQTTAASAMQRLEMCEMRVLT